MFDDKISYIRVMLNGINPDSNVQCRFNEFPIDDAPNIAGIHSYQFDPKELNSKYGLQSLTITERASDSNYLNFLLAKDNHNN